MNIQTHKWDDVLKQCQGIGCSLAGACSQVYTYFLPFFTRYLFYSYDGSNATMVRAYMDGTHEVTLLKEYIYMVTDIVADIPAKRIYWVDRMLDYLESVQYDGRSRFVV